MIEIASPNERLEPGACRVIGLLPHKPDAGVDMRLRFSDWSWADVYLTDMVEAGIISSGHIETYIAGIGWVLADTDPEAE